MSTVPRLAQTQPVVEGGISTAASGLFPGGTVPSRSSTPTSRFSYSDDDDDDGEERLATPAASSNRNKSPEDIQCNRDLIELVRSQRILWCPSDDEHKNSARCEEAWRRIGLELGQTWTNCKTRWEHLRSSFMRILRKLPPSGAAYDEAVDKLKWPYFRLMEFIKDTMKQRQTHSNFNRPVRAVNPSDRASVSSPNGDVADGSVQTRKRSRQDNSTHHETITTAVSEIREAVAACRTGMGSTPWSELNPTDSLCTWIASEIHSFPQWKQREMRLELAEYAKDMFRRNN